MLEPKEVERVLGVSELVWVKFEPKLQEDPRTRLEPIEQLADRILGG